VTAFDSHISDIRISWDEFLWLKFLLFFDLEEGDKQWKYMYFSGHRTIPKGKETRVEIMTHWYALDILFSVSESRVVGYSLQPQYLP